KRLVLREKRIIDESELRRALQEIKGRDTLADQRETSGSRESADREERHDHATSFRVALSDRAGNSELIGADPNAEAAGERGAARDVARADPEGEEGKAAILDAAAQLRLAADHDRGAVGELLPQAGGERDIGAPRVSGS